MALWKLTITLEEPFCCAQRPLEGNETPTTHLIPATNLRGAIAAALAWKGRTDLLPQWFGLQGPRWSPAWPVAGGEDDLVIPTPLCWMRDKSGKVEGIRNLFLDRPSQPWQRLDATLWVVSPGGSPKDAFRVRTETQMHVALDYERQASRRTALYSRTEILPGQEFHSWVEDAGGSLTKDLLEGEVFLGKRRTAGSGLAIVAVQQASEQDTPWRILADPPGDQVCLQLMTDAIVPAPNGGYWRGFSEEMLKQVMALPETSLVAGLQAFSDSRAVPGWAGKWGLPREQAVAIRAGSACRFELEGVAKETRESALDRLKQGIGIRRVEGFGIVALQPAWLGEQTSQEKQPAQMRFESEARDWPGFEDVMGHKEQQSLANKAAECAQQIFKDKDTRRKLGALAAYSARVENNADVTRYLRDMAGRIHDRGWKHAEEQLGRYVKHTEVVDIHALRFVLGAASWLAPPDGGGR